MRVSFDAEIDSREVWAPFALRRKAAFFFILTWGPLSAILFYLPQYSVYQPTISLAVILLWLAAALAAVWWAGECRCPRCSRRFGALGTCKGSTNLTRGLFDKVCSNCKLRKFEPIRPSLSARAHASPG